MWPVGWPQHLHKGSWKPQHGDNVSITQDALRRRRTPTPSTAQYKLIIRCLAVVVQKPPSDMQARQVAWEEFKDCRARVKNYKGWEFVLHINRSQYRSRRPQLTWPSGLS